MEAENATQQSHREQQDMRFLVEQEVPEAMIMEEMPSLLASPQPSPSDVLGALQSFGAEQRMPGAAKWSEVVDSLQEEELPWMKDSSATPSSPRDGLRPPKLEPLGKSADAAMNRPDTPSAYSRLGSPESSLQDRPGSPESFFASDAASNCSVLSRMLEFPGSVKIVDYRSIAQDSLDTTNDNPQQGFASSRSSFSEC